MLTLTITGFSEFVIITTRGLFWFILNSFDNCLENFFRFSIEASIISSKPFSWCKSLEQAIASSLLQKMKSEYSNYSNIFSGDSFKTYSAAILNAYILLFSDAN